MEQLRKNRDEAIKTMNDEARAVFGEMCADLFKKYPTLELFSWTQYTPYFNDGDTCEFGVNSDCDIKWDGVEYEAYATDDEPADVEKCKQEVSSLISATPEDALQGMFGDHCRVTVPRKGKPSTDDYEHD